MGRVDFNDPGEPFTPIAEALFRSFIEDGSIIIEDQSPDEIILEYKAHLAMMFAEDTELHHVPDHRSNLWRRAENECDNGDPQIAVTLYALWIEHVVNGNLMAGFQRKGYDPDVISLLIRRLNIEEKTTKLWRAAGFEPLSSADASLISQIMETRNAFVHYKWKGYDETSDQSRREQLISLLERARILGNVFHSRENSLLWNGREDEITNFYREDLRRHAEEVGPFILDGTDMEGATESPPLS
jgi:hypothetical protein